MIALLLAAAALNLLLFVRNNWVYGTRMKWIHEDRDGYFKAVSYNRMMLTVLNWSRDSKSWQQKV